MIVGKMQWAVARGALLSREFLEAARRCPDFMGGFVAGSSLAAGQAFPSATDFSAVKIAVFAASILSAVVGTALLWGASRQELIEEAPRSVGMQVS